MHSTRWALALAALLAVPVHADEPSKWWLVTTGWSYHMDRGSQHNEKNYGIGVEYTFNETWSAATGEYWNSSLHTSRYYAATYAPWRLGPVKLGTTFGGVTGYGRARFAPLLAPTLEIEGRRLGLNALVIPPYAGNSWVFAVQLKARF